MTSLSSEIQSILKTILLNRKDVALLACQQRAKFEGWLKFELASAMRGKAGFDKIILEESYATKGRSDISFQCADNKWFVEMKTANTNWRAEDLENLGKPITDNIDGIIDDIMVLREKCAPSHGLAVFCIFPVPNSLWKNTRYKLNDHLRRIEIDGGLPENTVINNAEFVDITLNFGICTFALEIL